jgi:hypothetical protein
MESESFQNQSPVLEKLEEDFKRVGAYLQKLAEEMVQQQISKYPIFVAQLQEVDVGRPIRAFEVYTLNYHYNVSFIEEFVKKDIIPMERVNIFRESWKHPEKFSCLFLVTPLEAGFVYVPYREQ